MFLHLLPTPKAAMFTVSLVSSVEIKRNLFNIPFPSTVCKVSLHVSVALVWDVLHS